MWAASSDFVDERSSWEICSLCVCVCVCLSLSSVSLHDSSVQQITHLSMNRQRIGTRKEEWWECMQENLSGPVSLNEIGIQHFLPSMQTLHIGAIVQTRRCMPISNPITGLNSVRCCQNYMQGRKDVRELRSFDCFAFCAWSSELKE